MDPMMMDLPDRGTAVKKDGDYPLAYCDATLETLYDRSAMPASLSAERKI